MTKQEFMAFSLPYRLKFQISYKNCHFSNILSPNLFNHFLDNDCKPILRPLSDLTKPIEHKGEVFVPMIKLAELEGLFDIEINQECYGVFAKNRTISFLFRDGIFHKGRINYKENDWIEEVSIVKQFDLFQKLIEWHFAFGLDENDYIDVNTLEINPYK